jgi:rSAM/selenodomain-associated transferase 2
MAVQRGRAAVAAVRFESTQPGHMISIIIPTRNEALHIEPLLRSLQPLRHKGHEVIVVDGESEDGTTEIAASLVDMLLKTSAGRARQMNAGASVANGRLLWFLHADSVIPDEAALMLANTVEENPLAWGRFDIRLSGSHYLFRVVEVMINFRSRITEIATGDQGIFVSRELFYSVNGFPDQPLMEDIEISKTLKKISKPVCFSEHLLTSSRRWEEHGIARTIVKMWGLRLAYFMGTPADRLASSYDRRKRE